MEDSKWMLSRGGSHESMTLNPAGQLHWNFNHSEADVQEASSHDVRILNSDSVMTLGLSDPFMLFPFLGTF